MADLLDGVHDSKRAVMGSVLAWTFKYGVAPICCSGRLCAAARIQSLSRVSWALFSPIIFFFENLSY
jgi:hypothetical protein